MVYIFFVKNGSLKTRNLSEEKTIRAQIYQYFCKESRNNNNNRNRGGFNGGMGGGRPTPLLQGFDPMSTQRVPLWYFLRNPFLVTDP